jgi:hypothetical protein
MELTSKQLAEIATIMAALVALATLIHQLRPRLSSPFCYVLDALGQPLAGGEVGNSYGSFVPIDERGRFLPPPEWKVGSTVFIYGPPDRNGRRTLLHT